ncbi:flagellar biosynthesis regulator FlaF [Shimia sp. SDUM112013]|uniref:flagellar biosynthesis regulator FlaF n=1 Tax=Shimia sp. SDUM112013 TaxID=3136160 RepID=UPI0032ED4B6F
MDSNTLAGAVYSNSTPLRTPKALEFEAIAASTRKLKSAAQMGKKGYVQLANALYENRRLWTFLATQVADNENDLPNELRAQIFYLAQFTQVHSAKILEGKARVRPLIEINMALLRGLGEAGAGQ